MISSSSSHYFLSAFSQALASLSLSPLASVFCTIVVVSVVVVVVVVLERLFQKSLLPL